MKERIQRNRSEFLPASIVKKIQKIFPSFDAAKLKEADLEMWRAIRAGKAAPQDYEAYRDSILKDEGRDTTTLSSSRLMFLDFLGDKMQVVLYRKEVKKNN